MAGLVLGVESVPDGLAAGLLAGVNPVAGLYAYLYGLVGGAMFTSTSFMAIQGTGAMAIIIADVDLASREDPTGALVTLSMLTGIVMIVAGLLRLGSYLRLVSNSVMTGFVTAVGLNMVLGQLADFTGYEAEGDNRIVRAFDLLLNIWKIDLRTTAVGAVTIALIVLLQRTRLGALGLVVAILVGSGLAAVFNWLGQDVAIVRDTVSVPNGLPFMKLPVLRDIPVLIVPAMSLAFVGLVQGAGVSAGFPNEDGTPADVNQDFVGQGAGNIVSGLFRGLPVGGSASGTSLAASAGAKSRAALFYASATMAIVILLFGDVVEFVAMPALAGLLIVIGVGTVKPSRVMSVAKASNISATVMAITLVLTMIIPLQYSVLVGVGISVILVVVQQSSRLTMKRMIFHDDGRLEEVDPPVELPTNDVVVIHPYGALFFATAPALFEQLPVPTERVHNSVVILRVRGIDDAGATLIDVLQRYAESLREVDSKLMIVTDNQRVIRQLRVTGAMDAIGVRNIYGSNEFVGATVSRANEDALAWVEQNQTIDGGPDDSNRSDREAKSDDKS